MSFWDTIKKIAGPALGAVAGSELGGLTGVSGLETVGGALGGALGGGVTNGTTGAIEGGIGGAIYPNISDIYSGINSYFTGGGGSGTGAGVSSLPPNITGGVGGGGVQAVSGPTLNSSATPAISAATAEVPSYEDPQMADLLRGPLNAQVGGGGIDPASVSNLSVGANGAITGATGAVNGAAGGLYNGTGVLPVGGQTVQPSAIQNILKKIGGSVGGGDLIKALPALASVGFAASQSGNEIPFSGQLSGSANTYRNLADANLKGQLSPAQQSAIDTAAQSRKAQIRSDFAGRGMSGSSSESDALAQVDQQSQQQQFQMAQSMIDQGLKEAGLSDQLYAQLANAQLSQDKELQDAISQAASAFSRPTIQIGA